MFCPEACWCVFVKNRETIINHKIAFYLKETCDTNALGQSVRFCPHVYDPPLPRRMEHARNGNPKTT